MQRPAEFLKKKEGDFRQIKSTGTIPKNERSKKA